MRRSIKNTLMSALFIAGLLGLMLLASRVAVPKGNGPDDYIIEMRASGIEGEPTNTIDMVVVGDSETYRCFAPLLMWKEHGVASYCCGTPGQKLFNTRRWIMRVMRNQKPDIIMMETNELYRIISYSEVILSPMEEYFPVVEYHTRWKVLRLKDFYATPEYTYTERDKGYMYDPNIQPADPATFGHMAPTDAAEKISPLNLWYFRRIVNYCREQGTRLVLISTPSTVNWNMMRHNAVKKLSEAYGLDYIDLNTVNDEIGGDHLNHSGAMKVCHYLGRVLAEDFGLADHRDDPAYSAWDEALAESEAQGIHYALPEV